MATVITKIRVPHFVRGSAVWGEERECQSRDFGVPIVTPELGMNALLPPRSEAGPLFDVPVADIIDSRVETANRLVLEKNAYLRESLEMTLQVSALPQRMVNGVNDDHA